MSRRSDGETGGKRPPRHRIKAEVKSQIYELRSEGISMADVARNLGISSTSVSRVLTEMGGDPFERPDRKHCIIDGCQRPSNYEPDGYCRMHQMRINRGIPLDSPALNSPRGRTQLCAVEWCDRQRHSHVGYCEAHHYRYKKGLPLDTPFIAKKEQPEKCIAPACENKPKSLGYCSTHVVQYRKYGRVKPITVRSIWDECTYTTAHKRCGALWGAASCYLCVACGGRAAEWAYDGTDPTELHHDTQNFDAVRTILPYSRFPEFYMPMCKRCHKQRDMRELDAQLEEFREWRKSQRSGGYADDKPPF